MRAAAGPPSLSWPVSPGASSPIPAAARAGAASAGRRRVRRSPGADSHQARQWRGAPTGPVRAVTPHHVFELGFEAVNRSARHKSGIAVRFPRILRWRHDKPMQQADRLDTLRALAR